MQTQPGMISAAFQWLTVVVLCSTVAAVPWMLGGVVPAASLVLLSGAIVAAVLSALSQIANRTGGSDLPKIALPLLSLAIIGFWQLSPAAEIPAAGLLPKLNEEVDLVASSAAKTRSMSPADTRTRTANYLSLALIAVAAFQTIRTTATIALAAITVTASGVALSLVAMSLIFQEQAFSWNRIWELGWHQSPVPRGFASFINPNSAGGWLCLIVAITVGFVHWHVMKKNVDSKHRKGRLRISLAGRTWQTVLEFFADLTVWQILSIAAVAFLAAAVASTKSRGALAALAGAIILTTAIKSSFRRLPIVLVMIMLAGSASYLFLQSLDLSEGVTDELETLQDYESAVGSRPEHWADAIHAVVKSPLLGSGHGSYRFSTLSFETTHRNVWFRNADNQYLETLVEAGMFGLILFVSVGWIGLKVAQAATHQAKARRQHKYTHPSQPKLSKRILAGLGTTVTIATLSQAIAASVDYGIAMPPASSLLILLIAAASGYLNSAPATDTPASVGTIACSKSVSIFATLLVALAAAGFLRDQWHATQIDQDVVFGHRLLLAPIQSEDLDQVHLVKNRLSQSLATRPDDPEGLRLLSRLAIAEVRWQTLLSATDSEIRNDPNVSNRWKVWTLFHIVANLSQIEAKSPTEGRKLRLELNKIIDSQQLSETLAAIQSAIPHLPGIPVTRASVAAIQQDTKLFQQQAKLSQIIAPANAETLFELGILALRLNLPELAAGCWHQSLDLTNEFRAAILQDAIQFMPTQEALKQFGPESYSLCTQSAVATRNTELKQQLWDRAEQLWTTVAQPAPENDVKQRIQHLKLSARLHLIMPLVQSALKSHPDSVPLREEYAKQLEANGKFTDALKQWERIQFHHPDNLQAIKNANRLRTLK